MVTPYNCPDPIYYTRYQRHWFPSSLFSYSRESAPFVSTCVSGFQAGLPPSRFNCHFVGGDLEGSHVPPGWGRSVQMYNQPTLGFTQPGEVQRPCAVATCWHGVHSIMRHEAPIHVYRALWIYGVHLHRYLTDRFKSPASSSLVMVSRWLASVTFYTVHCILYLMVFDLQLLSTIVLCPVFIMWTVHLNLQPCGRIEM